MILSTYNILTLEKYYYEDALSRFILRLKEPSVWLHASKIWSSLICCVKYVKTTTFRCFSKQLKELMHIFPACCPDLRKELCPTSPFWRRSALGVHGRNDAKAETPILWPPHAKSWLIGKDSDAGKDWGQEDKGMTEDEMAGWHHRLNGHEFEWTPGDGDGQGGLASCDSWGHKESDTTERLNWTELNWCNQLPWSWFFSCWILSWLFHCPLSLSLRGCLFPLCFLL